MTSLEKRIGRLEQAVGPKLDREQVLAEVRATRHELYTKLFGREPDEAYLDSVTLSEEEWAYYEYREQLRRQGRWDILLAEQKRCEEDLDKKILAVFQTNGIV